MICEKCNTNNPAGAKFCRICGTPIQVSQKERLCDIVNSLFRKISEAIVVSKKAPTSFTLDAYKSINFMPKSVVPIRFTRWYHYFIPFCLTALVICVLFVVDQNRYLISNEIGPDVSYYIRNYAWILFILPIMSLLNLIKKIIHKMQYEIETSFIESNGQFGKGLLRIAKNNRIGLFDSTKNKVRLLTKYSNIQSIDNSHILIEKNGLKGIYSVKHKKIIIPIKFDSISSFSNSICTATNNSVAYHYDVNGNRLK